MKGIIVAAGYGTRFLPITKTIPKEMLPLFDKPLIDFILDEFEEAGIKDVIIVTSRRKKTLDDYLDREVELEIALKDAGKTDMLDKIKHRDMNFIFIRQPVMKGTGHALLLTKSVIGDSPFIVAYPDDLVLSSPSLSKRMVDNYRKNGKNILAVRHELKDIGRYGVIDPLIKDDQTLVKRIIEKPSPDQAPSDLVSFGRYLFTPELLQLLEDQYQHHTNGEFYHIDAINILSGEEKVLAHSVEGTILDTGEPSTYFHSLLKYASLTDTGNEILHRFFKEEMKK